jgi:3',5'-cyclic AMP phosphodiesterase CpdA
VRIIQITDTHITDTDRLLRDIPVRDHFLRVLKSAIQYKPDVIVLIGDLAAEDGEIESY